MRSVLIDGWRAEPLLVGLAVVLAFATVTGALARYLRSFTGFSRDARLFLLTTVVFGAAISLYFIDFNLYLESIGLKWTIGWLLAAKAVRVFVVPTRQVCEIGCTLNKGGETTETISSAAI